MPRPPAAALPLPRMERIELREISLALKEPFRISSGVESHRRILLVRLAGEGVEGWGESVAGEHPNYGPETVDTVWLAIRQWLAPRPPGRRFGAPHQVWPAVGPHVRRH